MSSEPSQKGPIGYANSSRNKNASGSVEKKATTRYDDVASKARERMREISKIKQQEMASRFPSSPQQPERWSRGKNLQRGGGGATSETSEIVHVAAPHSRRSSFDATSSPFPFLKGAGLVPYRFKGKRLKLLVQLKKKNDAADEKKGARDSYVIDVFGGKLDKGDKDSASVAAREFCEETNCEPYMYLADVAPPKSDADYTDSIFPRAQQHFENLIRARPNVVTDTQHPESWGIYFVEMPRVPTNIFPRREDERTKMGAGDCYTAKWVDIWDILNPNNVVNRVRCTNIIAALVQIYRYEDERERESKQL